MKLPDTAWRADADLERLLRILGADDGETRFVGGCVRDTLLGLAVSDIDLATRLLPQEVMQRLKDAGLKAVPTGLAHGTVTAVLRGKPVEVTTLRRDVSTDGRRATVAFTDDWREDAARRDFTINALSADPGTGEIFDYFNGLADLDARRVRFIGDPLQRIAEDHLRILRFFRFHARFGQGDLDPAGLAACAERANDLMALSRERISSELLRLLVLPNPAPTIRLMIDHGILRPVLPEIVSIDRLDRLISRENASGVRVYGYRRLAALIPEDADVAEDIAYRLRLSSSERMLLRRAADRPNWRYGSAFQRSYSVGFEAAIDRLLLGDEPMDLVRTQSHQLMTETSPPFALKGSDLMAMGLPKGPLVSRTMLEISSRWVAEDFPSPARLREIAREAVAQALRSSQ